MEPYNVIHLETPTAPFGNDRVHYPYHPLFGFEDRFRLFIMKLK